MKISLIQLTASADMAANIAKVGAMIAQAHAQGAELIATPENTFQMEAPGSERQFYAEDEHPGIIAAGGWAKRYGVWILLGSVAVLPSLRGSARDDKTYNRSLLINPEGTISARYDKIHLFDVEVGDGQNYRESAKILPGDRAVVAPCLGAALGMSVCYDLRFPHLYRALAKAGAHILSVPSAFTAVTGEAHWHVLLRARAIENGCFVIAPAQCGTHAGGRKTYGHSLVVDPWGKIIAEGGTEPGIVMADIDLSEVEKIRARVPSLQHDRPFDFG
jgi:predicted amidohydrolase